MWLAVWRWRTIFANKFYIFPTLLYLCIYACMYLWFVKFHAFIVLFLRLFLLLFKCSDPGELIKADFPNLICQIKLIQKMIYLH